VKTQDAVEQELASSMLMVFVGVAKYGMGKKCVGQKSSRVMGCLKTYKQWILLKTRTQDE
jgi:secreted trypsin-like serine protease